MPWRGSIGKKKIPDPDDEFDDDLTDDDIDFLDMESADNLDNLFDTESKSTGQRAGSSITRDHDDLHNNTGIFSCELIVLLPMRVLPSGLSSVVYPLTMH